jgi:hypothetical protein
MKKKLLARAIGAATMALARNRHSARGSRLQEQNCSGLGNAYAGGAPVAEDASTVWPIPRDVPVHDRPDRGRRVRRLPVVEVPE